MRDYWNRQQRSARTLIVVGVLMALTAPIIGAMWTSGLGAGTEHGWRFPGGLVISPPAFPFGTIVSVLLGLSLAAAGLRLREWTRGTFPESLVARFGPLATSPDFAHLDEELSGHAGHVPSAQTSLSGELVVTENWVVAVRGSGPRRRAAIRSSRSNGRRCRRRVLRRSGAGSRSSTRPAGDSGSVCPTQAQPTVPSPPCMPGGGPVNGRAGRSMPSGSSRRRRPESLGAPVRTPPQRRPRRSRGSGTAV